MERWWRPIAVPFSPKTWVTSRRRAATLFVFIFVLKLAHATPQLMRVDGMAYDSTGAPVTGLHSIIVNAYSAATGGGSLWTSSTYSSVSVTNGKFTVDMDASVGSPSLVQALANTASSGAVWFEISYDGNIVRPRVRARGTTFALSSASTDALQGIAISTTAAISGNALVYNGTQWAPATPSGTDNTKVAKAGDSMSGTLNVGANIAVSTGQIYAGSHVVPGATADFNTGNVQVLTSVGGNVITLANMKDGAAYTVFVTDTTPRNYSFSGCTTDAQPLLAANATSGVSIFTIFYLSYTSTCYISWITGY